MITNGEISKKDYLTAVKYSQIKEIKDYDFIFNDIEEQIKKHRAKFLFEKDKDIDFLEKWRMNGWEELKNFIQSKIKIVQLVEQGKIRIKNETNK
jgi:hypothetical protein